MCIAEKISQFDKVNSFVWSEVTWQVWRTQNITGNIWNVFK